MVHIVHGTKYINDKSFRKDADFCGVWNLWKNSAALGIKLKVRRQKFADAKAICVGNSGIPSAIFLYFQIPFPPVPPLFLQMVSAAGKIERRVSGSHS